MFSEDGNLTKLTTFSVFNNWSQTERVETTFLLFFTVLVSCIKAEIVEKTFVFLTLRHLLVVFVRYAYSQGSSSSSNMVYSQIILSK